MGRLAVGLRYIAGFLLLWAVAIPVWLVGVATGMAVSANLQGMVSNELLLSTAFLGPTLVIGGVGLWAGRFAQLRVIDPSPDQWARLSETLGMEPDEELGWLPLPSRPTLRGRRDGFDIRMRKVEPSDGVTSVKPLRVHLLMEIPLPDPGIEHELFVRPRWWLDRWVASSLADAPYLDKGFRDAFWARTDDETWARTLLEGTVSEWLRALPIEGQLHAVEDHVVFRHAGTSADPEAWEAVADLLVEVADRCAR